MSFGVLRRVTSLTRCKGKHYFLFCKFFRIKMQKNFQIPMSKIKVRLQKVKQMRMDKMRRKPHDSEVRA